MSNSNKWVVIIEYPDGTSDVAIKLRTDSASRQKAEAEAQAVVEAACNENSPPSWVDPSMTVHVARIFSSMCMKVTTVKVVDLEELE